MGTQKVNGLADVDLAKECGVEKVPDQQSTVGGACDELKKVVGVDEGGGEPCILGGRSLWDGEEEFRDDVTTCDGENLDGDAGEAEEVAARCG